MEHVALPEIQAVTLLAENRVVLRSTAPAYQFKQMSRVTGLKTLGIVKGRGWG